MDEENHIPEATGGGTVAAPPPAPLIHNNAQANMQLDATAAVVDVNNGGIERNPPLLPSGVRLLGQTCLKVVSEYLRIPTGS